MRCFATVFAVGCLLIGPQERALGQDSDGDGLSDFQEVHKYNTDPNKKSTAGDGVSDGDWQRRREFAYTIRSVVRVMNPVNLECLNDDYQDARILGRGANYLELEVIHYPLNTVATAIAGDPNWRESAAALGEYVRPGVTTNWDQSMKRELTTALKADGIDPDRLDDDQLVRQAARWALDRAKFTNMFCTHYASYAGSNVIVLPGLEAKFESDKGNPTWTVQEQFEHELFGRSMFANRSRGTCTSTAVYLTTVLRALGVPTRMVLAIPVVDASDPAQVELVKDNLKHHRVRRTVLLGVVASGGYANHTFNEVYVGGRWVRLNNAKLGQDILDSGTFGLLTHVNTFLDLSDAGLAATWGRRYALGEHDDVFPHANPYRALEVSDHFGKFARTENPESREHESLTLSRLYWRDSPESPAFLKKSAKNPQDRAGYVLAHVEEWFADEPYTQYKLFLQTAPKDFVFQADGRPPIRGRLAGSATSPPDFHEIAIAIPPSEFEKMEPAVDYTFLPPKGTPGHEWKTKGTLTIKRQR
jgi:hypothetical protein